MQKITTEGFMIWNGKPNKIKKSDVNPGKINSILCAWAVRAISNNTIPTTTKSAFLLIIPLEPIPTLRYMNGSIKKPII